MDRQEVVEESPFLSNIRTSSTRQSTDIHNHVIHELLVSSHPTFEDAVRGVERSLLSKNPLPLTDTDRLLIEIQLRQVSVVSDLGVCIAPSIMSTLSMNTWIWNECEEEQIRARFLDGRKRPSKSAVNQEEGANTLPSGVDAKPKRQRRTTAKQSAEGEQKKTMKELTLTIPNHSLQYDGYLLTQDIIDRMEANKSRFVEYKTFVLDGTME